MKAKSVLIVEDDPYYRNDICTKLKDRGINTFEASSGVDALKQMALHAPEISVAVIDVNFIWKRTSKEQQIETHGKSAGLRLARHIREKHPQFLRRFSRLGLRYSNTIKNDKSVPFLDSNEGDVLVHLP